MRSAAVTDDSDYVDLLVVIIIISLIFFLHMVTAWMHVSIWELQVSP